MSCSGETPKPLGIVVEVDEWSISMENGGEYPPDSAAVVQVDDELVNSIKTKLQQARDGDESGRNAPPTIHRVRPSVRGEHPWAYDPQIVSVGPFHHGKAGLQEMERLKRRFMNDLLRRNRHNSVEKYVDAVRACAPYARAQYAGDVDLHPDAFVEMMVLDGCFIVEFLVKSALGHLERELTSANCNTTLLRNDCLLIENQLPFSVVKALFDASVVNWCVLEGYRTPTLMELATHFLKLKNMPARRATGIHHLLHLFHSSLDPALSPDPLPKSCCQVITPLTKLVNLVSPIFYGVLYLVLMCRWPRLSSRSSAESQRCPRMIPSATELREAGINISRRLFRKDPQAFFLKVSFQDGTLEIPFLSVEEPTGSKFRNLVAFEQCCPRVGSYFTSYAIFLDNLINTAADVAVLQSCGVMESKLGCDEEVAQMFNTVCKGSHLDYESHYLASVFRDVKRYCESSRHRWRAKLMHDYFSSPWAVISVVVAFLLLIFTGLQAVFAVLSFFCGPRGSGSPAPIP